MVTYPKYLWAVYCGHHVPSVYETEDEAIATAKSLGQEGKGHVWVSRLAPMTNCKNLISWMWDGTDCPFFG